MEVEAVASVGLHNSRELLGRWEDSLGGSGDRRSGTAGGQAVTTAEGQVVGAGHDDDGAGELALQRQAADGQELADGDGLLGLLGEGQDLGVVVGGVKEKVCVAVDVGVGQVARDVGLGGAIGDAGVQLGLLEVGASEEEREVGGVHGEAGEDDAVRDVGVLGSQSVGLGRSEGVADVDDLFGVSLHAGQRAVAQLAGDLGQGLDLEEGLDFVLGLAVRRVAHTQTVISECVVALGQGVVDIGIVEVVVWQIPVTNQTLISRQHKIISA